MGLQASSLRADGLAVRTGGEPPYECKPLHVALQDDGTIAPTDDWSQIIIEQVRFSPTPPHGLTQSLSPDAQGLCTAAIAVQRHRRIPACCLSGNWSRS